MAHPVSLALCNNIVLESEALLPRTIRGREVDQRGCLVDNYITLLNILLSRKAESLVSLQARLARCQHRLKEQEMPSRKKDP
ncbi:hypothetical protein MLD38_019641 [Melastoma candidum]|uniref:Uncharacterized protein n=1 Tax=Melastoma candidum TaxID=119954 RepID=A0ACB9QXM0_9MYRT|nr:hypothetical protein MLD38_019641 [Melastoma candidum]